MHGIVLDPTAHRTAQPMSRTTPTQLDLNGLVVGFRVDIMWRSWDWVSDVWEQALVAEGATVKEWRSGVRFGEEGDRMEAELAEWSRGVDLALSGLAN